VKQLAGFMNSVAWFLIRLTLQPKRTPPCRLVSQRIKLFLTPIARILNHIKLRLIRRAKDGPQLNGVMNTTFNEKLKQGYPRNRLWRPIGVFPVTYEHHLRIKM
jgi:hypothetical protein